MSEHLLLLLELYVRPFRAMSGILDRGNWMFGVIAAVVLTWALSWGLPPVVTFHTPEQMEMARQAGVPMPVPSQAEVLADRILSASTVLTVMCILVPLAIGFVTLFESLGHFTTVLSRDFAPMVACCSLAWIAQVIPLGLAARIDPPAQWHLWVYAACGVYFLVLTACALSVVFGAGLFSSTGAVLVAAAITNFIAIAGVFQMLIGYIASPFLLFWAYYYFGGNMSSIGQGFRSRQSFRRSLEAAAVNPHDADAQCQLGLIYQARRQYDLAIERFRNALKIDPNEPEALLQLGRILRDRGQFAEALQLFQKLAQIDPKYSTHEVWREAGSVYLALKRYSDARPVLEHYIHHRPYDAEALCYMGQTLQALNDPAGAADAYTRAVEAAATAPPHRRRFVSRWGRLAQRKLRDVKNHRVATSEGANAV